MDHTHDLRRIDPARVRLFVVVAALLGLFVFALWQYVMKQHEKSVARLPEPQRVEAYGATLRELQTDCRPPIAPALRDHCEEQASWILQFPECDRACRALAEPLVRPTARPR